MKLRVFKLKITNSTLQIPKKKPLYGYYRQRHDIKFMFKNFRRKTLSTILSLCYKTSSISKSKESRKWREN